MYIKGLGIPKLATGTTPTNATADSVYKYGYDKLSPQELKVESQRVAASPESVFKSDQEAALAQVRANNTATDGAKPVTGTTTSQPTKQTPEKPAGQTPNNGAGNGEKGSGSTPPKPKPKTKSSFSSIASWILNNPGATAGLATGALLLATDPFGMIWRQHKPGESPVNIGSLLGTGLVGGGLYAGLKYAPELFGTFSNWTRDPQEREDAQKAADKATGFWSKVWNGTKDVAGVSNNDLLEGLLKTKDLDSFIKQAEPLLSMPEVKSFIGDPRKPNWGADFKLGLDPDIILRAINKDTTTLNQLKAQHIDPKKLVQVLKHYHNLYKGN